MSVVVKRAGSGREMVRTNDQVNPYGLRIDGTVVVQSWSRKLIERLLEDEGFCAVATKVLDEA
ncbi:hypothetical protein [Rhizobium leguminosarum]|uniref:hypothetical protein n=1 Tax=Rhizobium leguminosarum TaxID=384 RepID=UPI002E145903|nr:hypothetical protein U8Q02_41445 [Rhizobium leguminosarum]